MAKTYSQFKGRLHEYYKKKGGENKEVAIQHPHPDMDEDTRAKLCDIFADPKYEEKCKVNTENRKGLTIFHTAGTRTFARYRKVLETSPSVTSEIGQLNCMLHPTREKWDWLSDVAKDNHEKMRELQEQAISDGRSYNDIDILHQVLGPKPNYVSGLGRAVKPPRSAGSTSTSVARQLRKAQLEIDRLKAEQEAKIEQIRIKREAEIEQIRIKREAEMVRMRAERQQEMKELEKD
ncbi:hypothetical protein CJ030_MR0G021687 [Morella rubra]|uniref:Uncharacterized protein n=1 Tax=Morella rubra TaxID=262757 RepID=A0A6A1UHA5_9ROSI|nr:hypothetical protein CJ030_MR0G021687 [Morella rubra]